MSMALLRRHLLAASAMFAAPRIARAQPWPSRPIRLLIGFAPGGAADTVARLVAARMGDLLGQPIVVENRSGASSTIAAGAVAQSPPDGQTLLFATLTHATNPLLYRSLPFDYATAFTPISQAVVFPQLLAVHRDFPVADFAGFLAIARSRPQGVTHGTPGNASAQHLAAELLKLRTGARLEHVPYRGGAEAARDLMSGAIDAAFMTTATAHGPITSGAVRVLAVATPERLPGLPTMPAIAETVPGYALSDWCAMLGPARLPPAIAQAVQGALAEALRGPEVTRRLAELGVQPIGSAPAAFAAFLTEEQAKLGRIIRDAGIQLS